MKKVLSYILISIIISANLLAPISVGFDSKNNIRVQKNEALALNDGDIILSIETLPNDKQIGINVSVNWAGNTTGTANGVQLILTSPDGSKQTKYADFPLTNSFDTNQSTTTPVLFTGLTPGVTYSLKATARLSYLGVGISTGAESDRSYLFPVDEVSLGDVKTKIYQTTINKNITTSPTYVQNVVGEKISSIATENVAQTLNDGDIILSIETLPNDKQIGINVSVNWAGNTTGTANGVQLILTSPDGSKQTKYADFPLTDSFNTVQSTTTPVLFTGLTPGSTYSLKVTARLSYLGVGISTGSAGDRPYLFPADEANLADIKIYQTVINKSITTSTTYVQNVVGEKTTANNIADNKQKLPACSITGISVTGGTFMGCVVQVFYYVLFMPTSYLFALAGTMFDYTFSYSVQDSSYRSAFVIQGWGLVRDFCNMFFIFIMLYIAIGTILSLHSMKTKETIINVVIIGLFINFSLFATQVIIDASNITARVFYNSDAIQITEKGANGVAELTPRLKVGEGGVIPLSAALVNKVNPQNIIMNSDKINSVPNNTGSNIAENDTPKELGIGQFILVIIMASAVNIVGFTVFLTVAFLFIARVIGLWLAMIIAPLAFFTYILPEMADTKMIGWKHWWGDTLKLAFLAPVFIFFMYLILKFLQADLISDIASKSISGDGLGYFVSILVPFAFIMIFMIKAKKIATDMSGEFGELAVKAGSAASGMVLGGAVGVGAMAMRGTIGKMGDKLDKNSWVNDMAGSKNVFASFLGNKLKDTGQKVASKSFDVRNTEMGAAAGKGMGADVGKGKEGGYTKDRKDFVERKQKRAKEIEVNEDEELKQLLNKTEMDLQALLFGNKKELDELDKLIEIKKQALIDTSAQFGAGTPEAKAAGLDLQNQKDRKTALREGKDYVGDKVMVRGVSTQTITNAKNYTGTEAGGTYTYVDAYGATQTVNRTIANLEKFELKDRKADLDTKSRERRAGLASVTGFWKSVEGMEAEHNIIMEKKLDSGAKT